MPNLQYQYLHEKKTPNLQHEKLREENKNAKFTTSKFAREKKTPNLQHQNLREKKKRQIYNIKIYVRKKNAKIKTSKITWKKTRNSQHHLQHRGQHWTCAKTQIEASA